MRRGASKGRNQDFLLIPDCMRIILTCIARSMSGCDSVGRKDVSSMDE